MDKDSGRTHRPDWLIDPSRLLRRLVGTDISKATANASRAVSRSAAPGSRREPDHNDVLAQMSFGTWRYLLPDKDPGRQLLWRDALVLAFPHLEVEPRVLTAHVNGIHRLRNRVAHLEPLLRPGYVDQEFAALRAVVAAIDPDVEEWMVARQRVTSILRRRRTVLEG